MPDDDWALGQNMIDVRNEERLWRHGRLEPDPERHLATGPLNSDNCDCEALCDCDNSTTVEASTEPRTNHTY